ncbi:hypothetical protein [Shewanella halotolerans]|uniref:hypothetical protein n=1 Tax=Shewanella halotolerans TaxID=2864204 RepID=UPI001C6571B6|nr:hypothetical protein [Shewanella halotolerans]QYJ89784.1 hypothetical protein K0H81_18805 [Shewanella halotolerans]
MKFEFLTIILLMLASSSSLACELTEEYKKTRTEYVREARSGYVRCISATSESNYWYKHVQCLEAGDGDRHVGGCGHMATIPNDKYQSLEIDSSFCKKLKPSKDEMRAGFEEYIKKTGIEECKKT